MNIDNNIIFDTVNNGIIILDEDLKVLGWNKWLEIFTRIDETEIINKKIYEFFPYINEKKLKRKAKTVLITNNASFLSLDTNRFLIDIPVSNITNPIYSSMQQDITILPYDLEKKYICIYIYDNTLMCEINKKLEVANKELKDISHRDYLTQLFNRRYFTEQSEKIKAFSIRNGNIPLSLVILDIDKFKSINDKYGHIIGDEVIVSVAKTLEKVIRQSDIVARFGGEEFVILFQDCTIERAYELSEKIRVMIEQTSVLCKNNKNLSVSVSIGVAEFIKEDEYIENTVSRADKAMYKAKESGRNKTIIA